ncbi:hypothetical protein MIDIC_510030 [Alphaproteobacteria bacterium]
MAVGSTLPSCKKKGGNMQEKNPQVQELKALKGIYVIGPGIGVDSELKALYEKDGYLMIEDGQINTTPDVIKQKLDEAHYVVTKDTRIDLNFHGSVEDGKHKIMEGDTSTFFTGLKNVFGCPLYVHLWSCYGGIAGPNELGAESCLVTHIEEEHPELTKLLSFSLKESIKRYQKSEERDEGPLTPYEQVILDLPENFEAMNLSVVSQDGKETKKITSRRYQELLEKGYITKSELGANEPNFYKINLFLRDEAKRLISEFSQIQGVSLRRFTHDEAQRLMTGNEGMNIENFGLERQKIFLAGVLMHLFHMHFPEKPEFLRASKMISALLDAGFVNFHALADAEKIIDMSLTDFVEQNDVLHALIIKHRGINLQDNNGDTALHIAVRGGKTELVKILLSDNDDIKISIKNTKGKTPLLTAAEENKGAIYELLFFHKNMSLESEIDAIGMVIGGVVREWTTQLKNGLQLSEFCKFCDNFAKLPEKSRVVMYQQLVRALVNESQTGMKFTYSKTEENLELSGHLGMVLGMMCTTMQCAKNQGVLNAISDQITKEVLLPALEQYTLCLQNNFVNSLPAKSQYQQNLKESDAQYVKILHILNDGNNVIGHTSQFCEQLKQPQRFQSSLQTGMVIIDPSQQVLNLTPDGLMRHCSLKVLDTILRFQNGSLQIPVTKNHLGILEGFCERMNQLPHDVVQRIDALRELQKVFPGKAPLQQNQDQNWVEKMKNNKQMDISKP